MNADTTVLPSFDDLVVAGRFNDRDPRICASNFPEPSERRGRFETFALPDMMWTREIREAMVGYGLLVPTMYEVLCYAVQTWNVGRNPRVLAPGVVFNSRGADCVPVLEFGKIYYPKQPPIRSLRFYHDDNRWSPGQRVLGVRLTS
jgi:hypothetical protein